MHPGRLHPGGAPRHGDELERVEAVALRLGRPRRLPATSVGPLGLGRVVGAHAGCPPSPTKSKSRWPGSNGAVGPSRR